MLFQSVAGVCVRHAQWAESLVVDSGVGDATNRQHSVGMSWVSCEWGQATVSCLRRGMAMGLEALGGSCFLLIEGWRDSVCLPCFVYHPSIATACWNPKSLSVKGDL